MARYQRGTILPLQGKNKDVWYGRFREDVEQPDGRVKRVLRKVKLGTLEELPTKRAARRALDEHLDHINDLDYRPLPKLTFDNFLKLWERDYLPTLKPNTQDTEKSIIRQHIQPFFGKYLLDEIDVQLVQRFITSLQGKLGAHSIHCVYQVLHGIWDKALLWGKVKHNPFPRKAHRLPPKEPTERVPFTPEEVQQIIQAANEPYRTMFWIVAQTGIRVGEALALTPQSIDFRTGQLRVRKNMNRHRQLGTPKSRKGKRDFVLSPALLEHLEKMCAGLPEGTLLFPVSYGRAHDVLTETLDNLGISRRGYHCFRYANGTAMALAGADVKTLQTRLGHAKPDISIELYARQVSAADRALAVKLGAIFDPKLIPNGVGA